MDVGSVVVAMSPRLLGEVVCHALTVDGYAVSSVDAGMAAEVVYDVAIVSPGREHEVHASEVIAVDPDAVDLDALRDLLSTRQAGGPASSTSRSR